MGVAKTNVRRKLSLHLSQTSAAVDKGLNDPDGSTGDLKSSRTIDLVHQLVIMSDLGHTTQPLKHHGLTFFNHTATNSPMDVGGRPHHSHNTLICFFTHIPQIQMDCLAQNSAITVGHGLRYVLYLQLHVFIECTSHASHIPQHKWTGSLWIHTQRLSHTTCTQWL